MKYKELENTRIYKSTKYKVQTRNVQNTIKGNRYIKLLKIIKYESKKTGQTETDIKDRK